LPFNEVPATMAVEVRRRTSNENMSHEILDPLQD